MEILIPAQLRLQDCWSSPGSGALATNMEGIFALGTN